MAQASNDEIRSLARFQCLRTGGGGPGRRGAGLKPPQRFNISFLLSDSGMCIYMYIFRTCSRESYCANYLPYRVYLIRFCSSHIFTNGSQHFRWHVSFVTCIVACDLRTDLCQLEVLAKHILFASFYVGFGVLLVQPVVWQAYGVRYWVGALCFVFLKCFLSLQLLFAFACADVVPHVFFIANSF